MFSKNFHQKRLNAGKIIKAWTLLSIMDGNSESIIMVYVTVSGEKEAGDIGKILVEERLAACANIFPGVKSIYRWEEKIINDDEAVMILKTKAGRLKNLISRIKELHSYSCPCILSYPSNGGYDGYKNWILKETE